MWKSKSYSYRKLWLVTFTSWGLLFFITAVSLTIYTKNITTAQVIRSQSEWLSVYSESFLRDIQLGDTNSVKRRLELLVERPEFREISIKYGQETLNVVSKQKSEGNFSEIEIPLKDRFGTIWASLDAKLNLKAVTSGFDDGFWHLIVYLLSLLLFGAGIIAWILNRQAKQLDELLRYIHEFATSKADDKQLKLLVDKNIKFSVKEWDQLLLEYKKAAQNMISLKTASQISQLAARVAHDIRSPLVALRMISKDFDQLPEETRVLARSAINRINDIANNLIEKHKEKTLFPTQVLSQNSSEHSVQGLMNLVDAIVSEKRTQYRKRLNVNLEAVFDKNAYKLFANISAQDFTRALSNIVNNSFDAIGSKDGRVNVHLSSQDSKFAYIMIEDNGPGIPEEMLANIGKEGFTFGKNHLPDSGSGLGVATAKNLIAKWGGSLKISSKEGMGTIVAISIPITEPPEWFISQISLNKVSKVVVLDDDSAIHKIWEERFNSNPGANLVHLSSADEFKTYMDSLSLVQKSTCLYLIDYELIGSIENGLQLIQSYHLQSNSILVTSRSDDNDVLSVCIAEQIKMIPKGVASIIPIIGRPEYSDIQSDTFQ